MTASPAGARKKSLQNLVTTTDNIMRSLLAEMRDVQEMLDARIVTVSDRDEVLCLVVILCLFRGEGRGYLRGNAVLCLLGMFCLSREKAAGGGGIPRGMALPISFPGATLFPAEK
jgi:hypothetical protein